MGSEPVELIPVDPSLTRSSQGRRRSWASRWVPAILYVLLVAVVFSVWYFTQDRNLAQTWAEWKTAPKPAHEHQAPFLSKEKPASISADAVRRSADQQRVADALSNMRRLEPGQECLTDGISNVGTVVVRSVTDGTPTVRQFLEYGRPVKCVGDQRLY